MIKQQFSSSFLEAINNKYRQSTPRQIITFALSIARRPLITTSFGPNAAAILFSVSQIDQLVPVVWCDTGHNTAATIAQARMLTDRLSLNLEIFKPEIFVPLVTQNLLLNEDSAFNEFVKKVKLVPFSRAISKYNPDVWFTTVRKKQGTFRDTLDIFSLTNEGVLRVSPFYYFSDKEITSFLNIRRLPMEKDYFDPTKPTYKSECGVQFLV